MSCFRWLASVAFKLLCEVILELAVTSAKAKTYFYLCSVWCPSHWCSTNNAHSPDGITYTYLLHWFGADWMSDWKVAANMPIIFSFHKGEESEKKNVINISYLCTVMYNFSFWEEWIRNYLNFITRITSYGSSHCL